MASVWTPNTLENDENVVALSASARKTIAGQLWQSGVRSEKRTPLQALERDVNGVSSPGGMLLGRKLNFEKSPPDGNMRERGTTPRKRRLGKAVRVLVAGNESASKRSKRKKASPHNVAVNRTPSTTMESMGEKKSKSNTFTCSPAVLNVSCPIGAPTYLQLEETATGTSSATNLRVVNHSGSEAAELVLERKSFSALPQKDCVSVRSFGNEIASVCLEPMEERDLTVIWRPSEAGQFQHTLYFIVNGRSRLSVVAFGRAIENAYGNVLKSVHNEERKENEGHPPWSIDSVLRFSDRTSVKGSATRGIGRSRNIRKSRLGLVKSISKPSRHKINTKSLSDTYAYFHGRRWLGKQESSYSTWVNHVIFSDEAFRIRRQFADSCDSIVGKSVSLRMRARLWKLYSSDSGFVQRMVRLERFIDEGKLVMRRNGAILRDMKLKAIVVDVLMNYQSIWLKLGMATVLGLDVAGKSEIEDAHLEVFIRENFLNETAIAGMSGAKDSAGRMNSASKVILKRFLVLVGLLDAASVQCSLPSMPPLLRPGNDRPKSSADIVRLFCKECLRGEGDVLRHLRFLGYKLVYSQSLLDEYDFEVKNLAVDLRDGVRLCKIIDTLLPTGNLLEKVVVPATARAVKIANTDLAMQVIKSTCDSFSMLSNVQATDIVDGNREKTLAVLWSMMLHWQLPSLINKSQLQDVVKLLAVKQSISPSVVECVSQDSNIQILFHWAKLVVSNYGLNINNFNSSFADGSALCYIITYYAPALLEESRIYREGNRRFERDDLENDPHVQEFSMRFPKVNSNFDEEGHLAGVKSNLNLIAEKAALLGGIPNMLKKQDFIDNNIEEQQIIAFVGFLCSRLLDLNKEILAVKTIQNFWRARNLGVLSSDKKESLHNAATTIQAAFRGHVCHRNYHRCLSASIVIQSFCRMYRERNTFKQRKRAAVTIQKHVRGYLNRLGYIRNFVVPQLLAKAEENLINLREARWEARIEKSLLKMQSHVRGFLARKKFVAQQKSCLFIQACYRRYRAEVQYASIRLSCITIQASIRGWIVRAHFEKLRTSTLAIQSKYRAWRACKLANQRRNAVLTVQTSWRRARCERHYLQLRESATKIQSVVRGFTLRKHIQKQSMAATTIQSAYRGHRQMQSYRQQALALVVLQAGVRGFIARNRLQRRQDAAITIQSAFRRHRAECMFQALVVEREAAVLAKAATLIQSHARGFMTKRSLQKQHMAATSIQSVFRRHRQMQSYQRQVQAIISLQAGVRGFIARSRLQRRQDAAVMIQSAFRRHRIIKMMHLLEQLQHEEMCANAATLIQSHARGFLTRRSLWTQYMAATTIQSVFRRNRQMQSYQRQVQAITSLQAGVRGFIVRSRLQKKQDAAVIIQSAFRRHRMIKMMHLLEQLQHEEMCASAATLIQSHVRGFLARCSLQKQSIAATTIQSAYRGHRQMQSYRQQALALVVLQAGVRGFIARNRLQRRQDAAITIQSAFRRHRAECMFQALVIEREAAVLAKAATLIQSHARGFMTRRSTQKQHMAATSIQSVFRRHRQMQSYQRQVQAIISLQAGVRGFIARSRLQRRQGAAVMIQSAFRCKLATKELQRLRQRKREHVIMCDAAVKIQANFRGYLVRLALRQLRDEIFCRDRAAAIIQARFRGIKAREMIGILKREREDAAASRIQNVVRRFLFKVNQTKIHRATLRIQTFFRGYTTRKSMSERMRKVHCRFISAGEYARLHPETLLCNQASTAIDTLMFSKGLSQIVAACNALEKSTSYCSWLCNLLVERKSIPVLFRFIRSCNRSKPHVELLNSVLGILSNISNQPSLVEDIYNVNGCVLTLMELLQTFRDKEEPFLRCVNILTKMFQDTRRREAYKGGHDLSRRISAVLGLHTRKAAMEKKCISVAKPNTSMGALVESKRKLDMITRQIRSLEILHQVLNDCPDE